MLIPHWAIPYLDTSPNYTLSWYIAELNQTLPTYCIYRYITRVSFHLALGQISIHRCKNEPQVYQSIHTGVVQLPLWRKYSGKKYELFEKKKSHSAEKDSVNSTPYTLQNLEPLLVENWITHSALTNYRTTFLILMNFPWFQQNFPGVPKKIIESISLYVAKP